MHDIGVFFLCLLFVLVVCLLECTEIVTESDLPFFSFPTVSPICHSRTLREGESQRHTEAYSHMSTHTHTHRHSSLSCQLVVVALFSPLLSL